MNELAPTQEEYEEAKRTNDLSVINRVIQHGIRKESDDIIEENINEELDESVNDEEDSSVSEKENETEENQSYADIVELERHRQADLEEQLATRDAEIERLKLLAEEQKNMMANRKVPEYEPVNPNDFDNEYDMLLEETSRMREYINTLPKGTEEESIAQKELQSVEQKLDSVTKLDDDAKQRRAISDEFSAFWRQHKELDPGVPFKDVQDTYINVCEKVQEVFGVSEAEANIRLAKLFDKREDKRMRELFEKNGIDIPDDFDKIYESARVYDYMNGKILNTTNGTYRDVLNRFGKQQTFADMDTAYKIMNEKRLSLKKEREAFQKAQEFYNRINKMGAREIPKESLANIRKEDTRDVEHLRNIITDSLNNPLKYKTDPSLASELRKAQETIMSM